jgi:pimeloyl-ACP methyl ester carboxylesterase
MKEFPVFVPFEDDHIAAVLTVPDSDARGLVQLLQGGGGQSRSHRNRTWIRLARGLADVGIASIRMDYPGLGDSTGFPRFQIEAPPVGAAFAVARVGLEAVGVDRFALVGNCIGIPTALELAPQMVSCLGVACIVPVDIDPVMKARQLGRTAAATRAAGRRLPVLRRVVRDLRRRGVLRSRPLTGLRPEVGTILGTANVLILHGGTEESWTRLRTQIDHLTNELDDERAARLVTRTLPSEGPGFRELRFQQAMVDACLEWLDELFPDLESMSGDPSERRHAATR